MIQNDRNWRVSLFHLVHDRSERFARCCDPLLGAQASSFFIFCTNVTEFYSVPISLNNGRIIPSGVLLCPHLAEGLLSSCSESIRKVCKIMSL
jgi:hypothetical protein